MQKRMWHGIPATEQPIRYGGPDKTLRAKQARDDRLAKRAFSISEAPYSEAPKWMWTADWCKAVGEQRARRKYLYAKRVAAAEAAAAAVVEAEADALSLATYGPDHLMVGDRLMRVDEDWGSDEEWRSKKQENVCPPLPKKCHTLTLGRMELRPLHHVHDCTTENGIALRCHCNPSSCV